MLRLGPGLPTNALASLPAAFRGGRVAVTLTLQAHTQPPEPLAGGGGDQEGGARHRVTAAGTSDAAPSLTNQLPQTPAPSSPPRLPGPARGPRP